MPQTNLRVYHGPEQASCAALTESATGKRCVTLPVGDILPLLADAVYCRRTWLRDFDSDEMTISADLYEVLLAYRHYRKPSA